MNFLDILDRYEIPTKSMMSTVHYLIENVDLTDEEYRIRIIELTGFGDDITKEMLPKYAYLYIIQEAMRAYGNDMQPVNMASMYTYGLSKATQFLEDNPHITDPNRNEFGTGKVVDVDPKKFKRGAKKALVCKLWLEYADQITSRPGWIALLMKEVNMTKAGASTYYASLKNGTFGC